MAINDGFIISFFFFLQGILHQRRRGDRRHRRGRIERDHSLSNGGGPRQRNSSASGIPLSE